MRARVRVRVTCRCRSGRREVALPPEAVEAMPPMREPSLTES